MFTLSTWFCKKQANKAQEQLSQLSLKKPHERGRLRGRGRERKTWILTSLNSSSLVILSEEHYCKQVAASIVCVRDRLLADGGEEERREENERGKRRGREGPSEDGAAS